MLAYVSPILAHVGPRTLAYVGPMLAPCWLILGPMLRLCWRYVRPSLLKDSKMPIFHSRTPPRNQKQRKNRGFNFRQRKNWDRRRLRNTAKNDVFVTSHTHTRNTVNYGFSRHGVNRGWVGGRGRSAYNLRLPRKAFGKEGATALCRRPAKEHYRDYRDSRRDEKLTRA